MNTANKQIIEQIKGKIAEVEKRCAEEVNKLMNAMEVIDSLGENDNEDQLSLMGDSFNKRVINFSATIGKKVSLRMKIEKLLLQIDRPLTSRMLMDEYNKTYPAVAYRKFRSFSGSFSAQYRKPKSKIRKYEPTDAPIELSAFYCHIEWFEGEELKEEYKQKILENYGVK